MRNPAADGCHRDRSSARALCSILLFFRFSLVWLFWHGSERFLLFITKAKRQRRQGAGVTVPGSQHEKADQM